LREDTLKDLLESFSFNALFQKMGALKINIMDGSGIQDLIEFLNIQSKLKYLLQTPSVLYDCLLNQVIEPLSLIKLLDENEFLRHLEISNNVIQINELKQNLLNIEQINSMASCDVHAHLLALTKVRPPEAIATLMKWLIKSHEIDLDSFMKKSSMLINFYSEINQLVFHGFQEGSSDDLRATIKTKETDQGISSELSIFVRHEILLQLATFKAMDYCPISHDKLETIETALK
jgi:hypothetical protein